MANFCTACGTKINGGDKFCPHCGNRVRSDVATTNFKETPAQIGREDDLSFEKTVGFLGLTVIALDKLDGHFGDVIDVAASVINDFDMLDIGDLADISDVADLADLADAADILDGLGILGGLFG